MLNLTHMFGGFSTLDLLFQGLFWGSTSWQGVHCAVTCCLYGDWKAKEGTHVLEFLSSLVI
jgi:hypothetical protein